MQTPSTLVGAIKNGLQVGPLNQISESVRAHVRDYLAQAFGAEMLKHPENAEMLKKLFKQIVDEPEERKDA